MTTLRETTSLDGAREELRIAREARDVIARRIWQARQDHTEAEKVIAHYRAEVQRQGLLQAIPKGREAYVVIAVSDQLVASVRSDILNRTIRDEVMSKFNALAPDATTIDIDEHPTKLTPEELAEVYPLSDYADITGYRWKASIS